MTNTTGTVQILHGWIDFNGNGLFESTESTSVTVGGNITDGIVILNWDSTKTAYTMNTKVYMRLRISNNNLVDNVTTTYDERAFGDGVANGSYQTPYAGEIEDYQLNAIPVPPTMAITKDGDVYIRGKYVQGGISNIFGTFGAGSNANRPPGFMSSREYLYGFIVNQNKDGWVTYNGDYFTPGVAEEGFTLTIGSNNYSNNRIGDLQISGSIISVENNTFIDGGATASRVVWVGQIGGIEIENQYIATQNGLFIKVVTSLKNVSENTINDIYYMRNMDPDNNQTINGSFTTTNLIESQISETSNEARVSATQPDGSYMTFYSRDPRARVSYGGFSNRNAKSIYNGEGVIQTVGVPRTQDEAISISYNVGSLAPGETTVLDYFNLLEDVEEPEACFIPAAAGTGLTSNIGISSLARDANQSNWPMNRNGAWLVLESPSKAFVPNRVMFNEDNIPVGSDGISPILTNPVEGMMVYDKTNKCLKIYTTKDDGVSFDWYCMKNGACPE